MGGNAINNYSWALSQEPYISHFGIKGMRWGVRRYQNEDGSLTALGRNRVRLAEEKAGQKQRAAMTATSVNAYTKALKESDYAQRKVGDAKIQAKLDKQKKKSAYQLKREEEYKKQGMDAEQAAIAAYKDARTRKILIAAAATTITVAAAYGAYKYYDNFADKYVKAGTTMQRLDTAIRPVDAFGRDYTGQQAYWAVGDSDKSRYVALFGRGKYQRELGIEKGFKVASDNSAYKALKAVAAKDPTYTKELQNQVNFLYDNFHGSSSPALRKVAERAKADIAKGKVTKDVYKLVNVGLVDHSPTGKNVANKLYTELASRGYKALQDVNDRKYSGFNSDNPIITFDILDSMSKTIQNTPVDDTMIQNANNSRVGADMMKKFASSTLPKLAVGGAGAAAASAVSKADKQAASAKQDRSIINQYKKEHPGSKLSDSQILDNYYNY